MASPCCARTQLFVSGHNTIQATTILRATRTTSQLSPAQILYLDLSKQARTQQQQQRRQAHTKRHISTTINNSDEKEHTYTARDALTTRPLSCLSWSNLIRSYAVTSISSIPTLLKPSMAIMTFLAHSKSRFFDPDHNRLLHALLKRTFYMQFCAGETPTEVTRTITGLKAMGYKGVMLGHAREVVMTKEDEAALDGSLDGEAQADCNARQIAEWREASLETVKLAPENDFVSLKFTGAGRQALQHLKANSPCSDGLRDAIHEVCTAAQQKGVKLLFDAEQHSLQEGIENWTRYYMRHYNNSGRAVVYGTYQAYMKRCPGVLAQDLAIARQEGFVLGIKLVRGAYLGSDPRELFWSTIEDTHKCYNNLARCIIERRYEGILKPAEGEQGQFPEVNFVLASHNAESVKLARQIRNRQTERGQPRIEMAYGQLMGMADHVSCDLIQEARNDQASSSSEKSVEIPQAYKYLVWGTMGECMKYLLRRAHENKDAISRTVDARKALGKEIAARLGLARA